MLVFLKESSMVDKVGCRVSFFIPCIYLPLFLFYPHSALIFPSFSLSLSLFYPHSVLIFPSFSLSPSLFYPHSVLIFPVPVVFASVSVFTLPSLCLMILLLYLLDSSVIHILSVITVLDSSLFPLHSLPLSLQDESSSSISVL